jgi:hypothetical protein
MALYDKFSNFFTQDPISNTEGKLTSRWLKSFDALIQNLNLFFKIGKQTLGVGANNVSEYNFFQVPSMSTAQRDSVDGLNNGLLIYNNTTDKFQGYASGVWVDLN